MAKSKVENDKVVEEVWTKARSAMDDINGFLDGRRQAVSQQSVSSKMVWYALIYNASTKNQAIAEHLYKRLSEWIEEDLRQRVVGPIQSIAARNDPEQLFRLVARVYHNFKISKKFGRLIFSYLDQYLTKKRGHGNVDTLYLKAFHKAVYKTVASDLLQVILRNINLRREGYVVNMDDLKSAILVFVEVGASVGDTDDVYNTDFENPYISDLSKYYNGKGQARISKEGECRTYAAWADAQFELEERISKDILRPATGPKVNAALRKELLENLAPQVINNTDAGIAALLDDWKEAEIRRLYHLFKEVTNSRKLIADAVEQHIVLKGAEIVSATSSLEATGGEAFALEKTFVERSIELHRKYSKLFVDAMEKDQIMTDALNHAFEQFYNVKITQKAKEDTRAKVITASEIHAAYVDAVMKRELKDIVDPQAELERIDQLATLFTYLKEKDVFQEYHKAKLAKRLLQTTPNEELEKAFIEKLQRVMGKGYTHKMEGMLHDRESTLDISKQFPRRSIARPPSRSDMPGPRRWALARVSLGRPCADCGTAPINGRVHPLLQAHPCDAHPVVHPHAWLGHAEHHVSEGCEGRDVLHPPSDDPCADR